MSTARLLVAFALSIGLLSGTTWAADGAASGLRQPPTVRQASFQNDEYDSFMLEDDAVTVESGLAPSSASPSDTPADPADGFQDEFEREADFREPSPQKPWTIPQPCALSNHGIKMGGWIQQGITLNAQDPNDGFNGPVCTNDFSDEYQLNQLWLYFDRPVNNGGYGWDIGGHVDVVYGTDWRFGMNLGLEDRINAQRNTYGLVLPQFYMDVAYDDLTVRIGHFAGILNYECIPSVLNFFYSHSYAMSYSVPLLVTGAMAEYKISDQWTVQGGIERGWCGLMLFEDINEDWDFMGSVRWKSWDGRTSIRYGLATGNQRPIGRNWYTGSLVFEHKFNDKLGYALVQNAGFADDLLPGGQDETWYGLCQYLFHTINPKWSTGIRFEWFRDDDGGRIAGVGTIPGYAMDGWAGGPGYAGNFYELSLGLNWRPTANMRLRPELRWDWYDGRDSALNPAYPKPFDDGTSSDQFTAAIDLLFTY